MSQEPEHEERPDRGAGEPGVYARLHADAEVREPRGPAPRWARAAGWLIAAGIVAVVIVIALRANPW
ncbi:MAG TPA: hypothetical protein VKD47_01720 [Miltoncostaeaceae bacterium]|nr:hypothetical protein [Miltoncostaeaceae bacterium]